MSTVQFFLHFEKLVNYNLSYCKNVLRNFWDVFLLWTFCFEKISSFVWAIFLVCCMDVSLKDIFSILRISIFQVKFTGFSVVFTKTFRGHRPPWKSTFFPQILTYHPRIPKIFTPTPWNCSLISSTGVKDFFWKTQI